MSRRVTYGAACSLDGFIARDDGAVDWLCFSADVRRILAEYWAGIDAVVLGRKTWEVAAASSRGRSPYGPTATYVCSRTLHSLDCRDVELVSGDAADFVRGLKEQRGKGICILGGGELAGSLLGAGVIDEVGLNIHPVLLGSGIPFVRNPGRPVELELLSSRTIAGGCLYATYRPTSEKVPARQPLRRREERASGERSGGATEEASAARNMSDTYARPLGT